MKRAFSLLEMLIMVAVLGILAAVVLPEFQSHSQQAKESAAKDNLRILRNAIELYATQHNGVAPGYHNNDSSTFPRGPSFFTQMIRDGHYLSDWAKNPFNGKTAIKMVNNDEDFPTEPAFTDFCGWVYKPATKTIKLNWSGTDSQGVRYFDY